jgi:predicted nuclease of predicted toxin-antitoxin system
VFERGWGRLSDSAILEAARKEGAVLVTADLDFPRLIAIRPDTQGGLILFRGTHWKLSAICDALVNIFAMVSDARLTSSIVVVEPSRIRIRKLRSE